MKTRILSIVLSLVIALPILGVFSPAPAYATDTLYFSDDFNRSDSGTIGGTWNSSPIAGIGITSNQAVSKVNGASANPGPTIIKARENARDALVEANIMVFDAQNAGSLILRYQDTSNYLYCEVLTSGTVNFKTVENGYTGPALRTMATGVARVPGVKLSCRIEGDSFTVLLDDVIIQADPTRNANGFTTRFLTGNLNVGLRGGLTAGATWDNFKISTSDIQHAYQVYPAGPGSGIANQPASPTFLNMPYSLPTGGSPAVTTITVTAAQGEAGLQAAIDTAAASTSPNGTVIVLDALGTYTGKITLPARTGAGGWVYVISSNLASLPAEGTRVSPLPAGDARLPVREDGSKLVGLNQQQHMPKMVTANSAPALTCVAGTHHWRFVGIEFASIQENPAIDCYNIVYVNDYNLINQTAADCPTDIVFDRVYAHGSTTNNSICGIRINSIRTQVSDSWISDIHARGFETQAVGGGRGPGPLKVVNNYLEGAGENFMLGGADIASPSLMPTDLEFRYNWCHIPRKWQVGSAEYLALPAAEQINWVIKNCWELKMCDNAIVEYNIMDGSFTDGQSGEAIKMASVNQAGNSTTAHIEDITFQKNLIYSSEEGIQLNGRDTTTNVLEREYSRRVLIQDNLFMNMTGKRLYYCAGGTPFVDPTTLVMDDRLPEDVTIVHNTAINTNNSIGTEFSMSGGRGQFTRLEYAHNISGYGKFGVLDASGAAEGNATFYRSTLNDSSLTDDVHWGTASKASIYPAGNIFAATLGDVGFVNATNPASTNPLNWALTNASTYHNASTDGSQDLGCRNVATLYTTWAAVFTGAPVTANTAPSITVSASIQRTKDVTASVATVATVSDSQQAAGTLTVAVFGSLPTGVTVTGITNTAGVITATIGAVTGAANGANTITFRVTDAGALTANGVFTVNVSATPTVVLSGTSVEPNSSGTANLVATPAQIVRFDQITVRIEDILGNPVTGLLGITPNRLFSVDSILLPSRKTVPFVLGSASAPVPISSTPRFDVYVTGTKKLYTIAQTANPGVDLGVAVLASAGIPQGIDVRHVTTGRFVSSDGSRPTQVYLRVNRLCVDPTGEFLLPEWAAAPVDIDGFVSVLLPSTDSLYSLDGQPVLLEMAVDVAGNERVGSLGFTTPTSGGPSSAIAMWVFSTNGANVTVSLAP